MEFCHGTGRQCGISLPLLLVCVFPFHFEQGLQQWNYCASALLGMFFQGTEPSVISLVLSCFSHPNPGEGCPYQATKED